MLPSNVASDPQFRDRFGREARIISQLDHPHICTLYDVGEDDPSTGSGQAVAYLVMQYLEGETLAHRLTKGGLPLDHALQIAIQLADALATAHRAGIVHRDLKPGNIMLTRTGGTRHDSPQAKLLDFGLAKTGAGVLSATSQAGVGSVSMLPTAQASLTAQGTILGTLQYMAPEQLEGKDADGRTDIFAFGAVLHEMLTGRKAFEGKTQANLIGAILERQPESLRTLAPEVPPLLEHIVNRCLAKDPDDRWQAAGDVMRELRWVADAPAAVPVTVSTSHVRRTGRTGVALLAVLCVALAAAVTWAWLRDVPESPVWRLDVVTPPTLNPFRFARGCLPARD